MTGNIHSSDKYNTVKKTVIEDMEDGVNELPNSDFAKVFVSVFDK